MGREIRRVPPNWEHPKNKAGNYIPMFEDSVEQVWADWLQEWTKWITEEEEKIRLEHGAEEYPEGQSYRNFRKWVGNTPDPDDYVPESKQEKTWWQVYETVSEGTPVTPPFATQDELIEYLVTNGDFWDQKRRDSPWSRERAEQFVRKDQWAPTFVMYARKDNPS